MGIYWCCSGRERGCRGETAGIQRQHYSERVVQRATCSDITTEREHTATLQRVQRRQRAYSGIREHTAGGASSRTRTRAKRASYIQGAKARVEVEMVEQEVDEGGAFSGAAVEGGEDNVAGRGAAGDVEAGEGGKGAEAEEGEDVLGGGVAAEEVEAREGSAVLREVVEHGGDGGHEEAGARVEEGRGRGRER